MKLLTGPRLGVFNGYQLGHLMVTNWAKSFSHYKNWGFKRFVGAQLSFCIFFCVQLFANFLKIASLFFRKKRVQKLGFSNFCLLSSFLENSLFLGLLQHYKIRGFSNSLCFFIVEREEKGQTKMITGIYEFVFLSKMAVS